MKNRRDFLKYAGAIALGGLTLPALIGSPAFGNEAEDAQQQVKKTTGTLSAIGLQLYSVKDVLEKDLKGTLQKLAKMGYKEVESYPGSKGHYYGMAPKEFSSMLNDMGLKLVSSHFGSGAVNSTATGWHDATMVSNFEQLVEKATETGQKYLTCAWMDESLRKTRDDLKKTAELFNKTGEICKKAGLTFAYHNHDFEFKHIDGVEIYDFLLKNTDPETVKWELDIYWAAKAGKDAATYFKQYPNRFPLCHIKDMDKKDNSRNTEIGNGTINFPAILKAAKANGMKHFLIEQETFVAGSLESMEKSYKYLAKLAV